MPSDIQVFVRFKEHSVFAGEEIQSTITFKNVASVSDNASDHKSWQSGGLATSRHATEHSGPGASGGLSLHNPRLAAINKHGMRKTSQSGHRTTASLSIPATGSSGPRSASWTASPVTHSGTSHKHKKSVSIISLASPEVGNEDTQRAMFPPLTRPTIRHSRSESCQVNSGRIVGNYDGLSSSSETPQFQVPTRKASAAVQGLEAMGRSNRADAQFVYPSKSAGTSQNGSRRPSPSPQGFKFPSSSEEGPANTFSVHRPQSNSTSPRTDVIQTAGNAARLEHLSSFAQATRVLAGTSVTESNRSSGDFQSLSNKSQETLISEQASSVPERRAFPSAMMRQHYRIGSTSKAKKSSTETLLMGYAQVNATFTLDGALVDQTPFEEVKLKGFLGGQGGGGVVGVKNTSSAGGFLSGFSLNNIGDSIGGLLGGSDLSSLKEMKGIVSSRSIPLLSTPQSLLFVDLTLVPGEEKSFSFRYTLPEGLPASYKGKAIKITYNLNVGVQGAPGEKAVLAMRRVNVPFKVFTGVNHDGQIYGHDLMQPYVILKDTSHTEAVESSSSFSEPVSNVTAKGAEAATQDFLAYVDTLLNKRRRRQSSSATLEPPRGLLKDISSSRAKEAIDRAIFLAKQSSRSHQGSNRFDITRNGRRVGTIVLDRTLHRLGESVTASMDLSNAQTPCYSIRCTLESTEKVNPALALRSAASISRLSRRIYRSESENTLFAERVVFSPSIPVTATPSLMTSGVNLDWALRFDFVTPQVADTTNEEEQPERKDLLEVVSNDDRGSILAAVEMLQCETFEVSIPITVYGNTVVVGTGPDETVGLSI